MNQLPPPGPAAWPPPPPPSVTRRTIPRPQFAEPVPAPTLPLPSAVGAIVVFTGSLFASKILLDRLVDFRWPVVVYVVLLGAVGYGPSLVWCRYASDRWGSGQVLRDVGLQPRWSDLGWGPVVWFGAILTQLAMAAIVLALDVPISNNTEGISELQADRTYVVSLVITAVVAAPLVEEMVFRGVVLRGLHSRLPIVAALVVQAVLFGAAHADPVRGAGNIGLVLVLSGVGTAFGVAAHLLRRIGPVVVAHALFNGVVLVIVLTGIADDLG